MAELRERVLAEEQNITRALEQMPPSSRLHRLNELELAGTAACGVPSQLLRWH